MRAGDKVKLVGIPPDVQDKDDLQTRTLFEKCLGQTFVVVDVESVDGLPFPLAKLDLFRPERTDLVEVRKDHRPQRLRRCSGPGASRTDSGSKANGERDPEVVGSVGTGTLPDPTP
jgi:hypothetical protein